MVFRADIKTMIIDLNSGEFGFPDPFPVPAHHVAAFAYNSTMFCIRNTHGNISANSNATAAEVADSATAIANKCCQNARSDYCFGGRALFAPDYGPDLTLIVDRFNFSSCSDF